MECDEECIDIMDLVDILDESDSSDGDRDYECAPEEDFEEDYYSELKFMRGKVNWDDEGNRAQFFLRLRRLIVHLGLECPLPDLREILRPAEIEWLLAQDVEWSERLGPNDYRYSVIEFVAKTGYKDIPEAADDDGRTSSSRTTVVHLMAESMSYRADKTALCELFEIYDRYDVNYRDDDGYTHFHVACLAGCADVVEKFLELGRVDPNELVPKTGDSPLYAALTRRHRDVVELLLRAGADPNVVHATHGRTPLHRIVDLKNPHMKIDFLEMFFAICREKGQSVKIDALDAKGLSPLHFALTWRRHARTSEVLATLVANGADPNLPGPAGKTPLHMICSNWDDADHLVEALFEACDKKRAEVLVDALDAEGRTPLHLALSLGEKKVASALLKRGADPNLENDHGETALHVVCADYLECDTEALLFELLVASKIRNVNAATRLGKTPLHVALAAGHRHIVRALLIHGADPNQADGEGSTPLHMVCQMKVEHELTAMLFEHCEPGYLPVQVDARDSHGWTPLHWAVYLGHRNSVRELLGYGADPNLADHQGSTTLHVLCQRPNIDEFAQWFFEKCAAQEQALRVDARDELGNTPLHYAVADTCQTQITRLLLEARADPNLANNEGSMPLHNICKRKQYQDDDSLTQLFFKVNRSVQRQLLIDARDHSGRTPLELAVANHLPHAVEVLVANGADVSSFVFPTEAFVAKYDRTQGLCYDVTTIKSLRSIGHLGRLHYLDPSDGLRIVGLFAEHGLLDESDELERCLDEDEDFANRARAIMINSDLSLHDLIRLPRGKAARGFTYEDYCAFANSIGWGNCPAIYREACDTFLCQSMARRYFQRWASQYLMLLIHSRLPLLCCDLIAEHLDLTDVWSICQAADNMNRS
ncbi:ankyrin-3-like [Trichogramma pretiosum]|uniref:ankyrin-3-like n=1 Tax=Trichogramma pretiosum TaxID=7493 RepID=UPI000C71B115|nr:ankyrin-3-like [Trichogramma pretiosum]